MVWAVVPWVHPHPPSQLTEPSPPRFWGSWWHLCRCGSSGTSGDFWAGRLCLVAPKEPGSGTFCLHAPFGGEPDQTPACSSLMSRSFWNKVGGVIHPIDLLNSCWWSILRGHTQWWQLIHLTRLKHHQEWDKSDFLSDSDQTTQPAPTDPHRIPASQITTLDLVPGPHPEPLLPCPQTQPLTLPSAIPGEQNDHPSWPLHCLSYILQDESSGHEVPLVENESEAVVLLQDRGQVWIPVPQVWVVLINRIPIASIVLLVLHENFPHLIKVICTVSTTKKVSWSNSRNTWNAFVLCDVAVHVLSHIIGIDLNQTVNQEIELGCPHVPTKTDLCQIIQSEHTVTFYL